MHGSSAHAGPGAFQIQGPTELSQRPDSRGWSSGRSLPVQYPLLRQGMTISCNPTFCLPYGGTFNSSGAGACLQAAFHSPDFCLVLHVQSYQAFVDYETLARLAQDEQGLSESSVVHSPDAVSSLLVVPCTSAAGNLQLPCLSKKLSAALFRHHWHPRGGEAAGGVAARGSLGLGELGHGAFLSP